MPIDVDCYSMAIRALWLRYDHYSDQATSFRMPDLPEEYDTNLGKRNTHPLPPRLVSFTKRAPASRVAIFSPFVADLVSYCENEYVEKVRIRAEQAEGRRLRLEEKKLELERLMNPPQIVPSKPEKKTKSGKKAAVAAAAVVPRTKQSESEIEPERLPYLPTPEQIILSREG